MDTRGPIPRKKTAQKTPSHRGSPMAPWLHWVHRAPVLPSLDDLHGQGLAVAAVPRLLGAWGWEKNGEVTKNKLCYAICS